MSVTLSQAARSRYATDDVPEEALEAYGYILLAVSAADGEISPNERRWFEDWVDGIGASGELRGKWEKFDPSSLDLAGFISGTRARRKGEWSSLIKEIFYYQCFVHATEYRIVLKGRNYRPVAEMLFGSEESGGTASDGQLPTMLMGREDFASCVDLLRNEGPFFLEEDERTGVCHLRTADELIGEGDITPERQPGRSRSPS